MLLSDFPPVTRRFLIISALLVVALLADVVLNDLNVRGFSNPIGWVYPPKIPTLGEPGTDLRILVDGSRKITHGVNPYAAVVAYPPPPFAAVFFYPFSWMSSRTAYVVQYWVLITLNLVSIGLIAACLFQANLRPPTGTGEPGFPIVATGVLVTIVALMGQFHGYGLEFALERGNFDSYVLFLASAAITCMIIWPERVLVPVALLSAASHLKMYPAILFALPLLQSWRRALVPLIVVNLAMLFAFGIQFARAFFVQIVGYMNGPYIWPGNHSIVSYVNQAILPALPASLHNPDAIQAWVTRTIALVVVGLWFHGMSRLRSLLPLSRRWLVMAALSFPVMGALSSTSHDYKLVIYVLPVLVNLYLFCETFLARGSRSSALGIILTLGCWLSINHSTIIGSWPFQETKFPVLFLLLLVTYFQTYVCCETSQSHSEISPASPRRAWAGLAAVAAGALAVFFVTCLAGLAGRRPAPAAQAPDSAGYGEIQLRLKLPGTSAGIPEPILVCGRPGNATSVYLRHLPNSQIKVGVEFWGKGAFESDPFDVLSPTAIITVNCSLPCLFPDLGDQEWKSVPEATQRKLRENYTITVNEVVRLVGPISYAQPAHSPRYYGLNPVGGSWVSNAFTGTVVSAVQITN